MQSSMKNHRSSPIRPFLRTSARQAFSFGLLAFHLVRISASFCRVSFFEAGAVADGPCAGVGVGEAMIVIESNATAPLNRRRTMNFLQFWRTAADDRVPSAALNFAIKKSWRRLQV